MLFLTLRIKLSLSLCELFWSVKVMDGLFSLKGIHSEYCPNYCSSELNHMISQGGYNVSLNFHCYKGREKQFSPSWLFWMKVNFSKRFSSCFLEFLLDAITHGSYVVTLVWLYFLPLAPSYCFCHFPADTRHWHQGPFAFQSIFIHSNTAHINMYIKGLEDRLHPLRSPSKSQVDWLVLFLLSLTHWAATKSFRPRQFSLKWSLWEAPFRNQP